MPSCGMSLRTDLKLGFIMGLRQSMFEASGDVPLYSLHRIRGMLKRQPMDISPELRVILFRNLILANAEYKEESGNDWNCLTSNNLVDAIGATDENLRQSIEDGVKDIPRELSQLRDEILPRLHDGRAVNISLIQRWFESNFENLLYDMRGTIPWAVVCRLRRDLGYWIATNTNPFGKEIEKVVMEVAGEEGIVADNPEDAWEKMGGKIFANKKEGDI
ncbi:MAG: hypothetical protein Q8Q06_03085 [bacterium]|nr:hypothetical protein [bacterium]